MRRAYVLVAVVVLVGYGLYGGLFLAAGAIHDAALLGGGPAVEANGTAGEGESEGAGTGNATSPFGFRNVSAAAGFDYRYAEPEGHHNRMVGNAGVYAADYDGDGWTDLLAIGGERPVLFENVGGEFRRSGALPDLDAQFRGALWFDYDDDGSEDLLLLGRNRPPLLLRNEGEAFVRADAGFEAPLAMPYGAAAADVDGDGCLDVYVIQYGNWTRHLPSGIEGYDAALDADNGHENYLYTGNCSTFERADAPAIRGTRWSLAVAAADLVGDDAPDLYVANDYNHDVLYRNAGDGSFDRIVLPERTNRNGMSAEVADVNGDGRLDVFVTNIYFPEWAARKIHEVLQTKAQGNNLLINRGNGTFDERATQYGVYEGGWGWAAVAADFDNDGDRDLLHTTRLRSWNSRSGGLNELDRWRLRQMSFYSYPAVWKRTAAGFTPVEPEPSGFEEANGRGVARLDYDNDGALDLVVAEMGRYTLYENDATASAVQVRPVTDAGSRARGATVTVRVDGRSHRRTVTGGTDFLSQDDGVVHVGVGDARTVEVRVVWPDGTTRTLTVRADTRVVVAPDGRVRTVALGDGG